jgi:hypothetical protein
MLLLVTLALGRVVVLLAVEAPPAGQVYRIGGLAERRVGPEPSCREAMRVLRYVETRAQLPALAAELVRHQVDLMVRWAGPRRSPPSRHPR